MKYKLPLVFGFVLAAFNFSHADTSSYEYSGNQDAFASKMVKPDYPEQMQRKGESGQALLKVIVSEYGMIAESKILSASRPEFGAAALDAIQSWEFEAAYKNGETVPQIVIVPVRFQFGEESAQNIQWVATK